MSDAHFLNRIEYYLLFGTAKCLKTSKYLLKRSSRTWFLCKMKLKHLCLYCIVMYIVYHSGQVSALRLEEPTNMQLGTFIVELIRNAL